MYIRMILFIILATPLVVHAVDENTGCKNYASITFGVLPFVSVEQLVIRFSPIAEYLSNHLNVPVRIETAPDFVEFARRTHEDARYDILFTAPHFYPQARDKAGYRLIVSVDSPGMWAVIVVPKDSPIKSLNDLVGGRLATVPPVGLATLLVRKHLKQAGINPDVDITLISTPSHDASLLSSYHRVTDASALMRPPFESASPQVRDSMRVLARTQSTPHIPISVSPDISDECAMAIQSIFLGINETEEGRQALSKNAYSGFKKSSDKEYEKIQDLLFN